MPAPDAPAPLPGRPLRALLFAVHLALVAAMLWWAAILALPIPTFSTSNSYRLFEQTWPYTEDGWACLFVIAAVVGLPGFMPLGKRALWISNAWPRLVSTMLLAGAHGTVAYFIYQANPGGTGTGIYLILACLALFRIAVEAKL